MHHTTSCYHKKQAALQDSVNLPMHILTLFPMAHYLCEESANSLVVNAVCWSRPTIPCSSKRSAGGLSDMNRLAVYVIHHLNCSIEHHWLPLIVACSALPFTRYGFEWQRREARKRAMFWKGFHLITNPHRQNMSSAGILQGVILRIVVSM